MGGILHAQEFVNFDSAIGIREGEPMSCFANREMGSVR